MLVAFEKNRGLNFWLLTLPNGGQHKLTDAVGCGATGAIKVGGKAPSTAAEECRPGVLDSQGLHQVVSLSARSRAERGADKERAANTFCCQWCSQTPTVPFRYEVDRCSPGLPPHACSHT